MREIAPDVFHIPLTGRDAFNAYVIGDVLVDTGLRVSGQKIREELTGRRIGAIAITHAHVDHTGSLRRLEKDLDSPPVWAGANDAEAVETGNPVRAKALDRPILGTLADRIGAFPGVPVDRRLAEGDDLAAGFTVLDVPGHSPGHVAFWRERDRVLIAGDVFFNLSFKTLRPGVGDPIWSGTVDPDRNRESQHKLAALDPEIVAFGHGPVIAGGAAAQLRAHLAAR